ncbi:MAG: serine/threonine-protein kinase [Kofleriaceae bacterium]
MSKDVDPHDETRAESIRPGKMVAGHPIGNYALISVLGEGGMGVVWRAHDPKLDREVAIKVLKRMDAPASLRQRLQREARAMARLKHPNVLTVYDSGTEGGRDFIAMELVDGCSLDVWLERHPMPHDIIAAVLASGRGLAAAHRAGLVHRDFKPHNILRSNDGRVLVTDFGLARGLGDITESQAEGALDVSRSGGFDETMELGASNPSVSGSRSKPDSVLDSPLTQTGVMIGTPAYMAPEQFSGAAPDPRTDQFAFCVTAWQMLTGGRPYHGASLEELKKAAGEGIRHVKSTLAPRVRMALVRGMDPDPTNRWPSMDELLDELEAATKPKRPRWMVPMVIGVMLLVFVLGGIIVRRMSKSDGAEARVCEAADVAFGDAWSPAVRADVWKQLEANNASVTEAAFTRVADTFDAWRTAWMQSYDEACRTTSDKLPRARLSCMYSSRDLVGALQLVLRKGNQQMFASFDAHGILPNMNTCKVPNPVASPQIPTASRAQILDVMSRAFTLRMQPDVAKSANDLLVEARSLGWPYLAPMIMLTEGNELLRRGQISEAREVFATGFKLAKGDPRLQATLRLGLLESSIVELATPDTPIRDGELPAEIATLVDAARSTAKSAGNDAMLMASVSSLEGTALATRARWSYDKRLFAESISALQDARRLYAEIGDFSRAATVASHEAAVYLMRADERALDDATFVARSAEEALEQAKLPPSSELEETQAHIALLRGEYAVARGRYAKLLMPAVPSSVEPAVSGLVTGPDGKPVGEATVIAWVGVMDGDPVNLVTDLRTLVGYGESVQTASDGTFTIHAPKGAAIVAQRGALRSAPQVIAGTKVALAVESTSVVSGRVDGRNLPGVFAFAQIVLGEATWRIRAPVHRDATYAIGGHPKIASAIGAVANVDHGERSVRAVGRPLQIEWPHGRAIEIIVRGELAEGSLVWVFPGRFTAATPKTRAEAEQLARTSTSFAMATPRRIGATATPRGRELYQRGDRHAVLVGNRTGFSIACSSVDDKPESTLVCVEVSVTDGEVTDFPDGRWGTDTQAVVIEL